MQFDFGNLESPLSGTVFINGNLEPWRDALHSSHKGGTRPSYAVEGMLWVNDTTNPWILNMFDGANDIALGSFDTTTNTFTPSGVSQAAEDISFNNTDSGLAATNVQDAIDEAVSDFSDFEGRADGFATSSQGSLADTAVQPDDLGLAIEYGKGVSKAWVNFTQTGTQTINDSYNVSSIVDNGNGDTTVNFIKNMANTNYVVNALTQFALDGTTNDAVNIAGLKRNVPLSLGSCRIQCTNTVGGSASGQDQARVMVSIFGDLA